MEYEWLSKAPKIEILQLGHQHSNTPQPQSLSQSFSLVDASERWSFPPVPSIHMHPQYSLFVILIHAPINKSNKLIGPPCWIEWNRSLGLQVPYGKWIDDASHLPRQSHTTHITFICVHSTDMYAYTQILYPSRIILFRRQFILVLCPFMNSACQTWVCFCRVSPSQPPSDLTGLPNVAKCSLLCPGCAACCWDVVGPHLDLQGENVDQVQGLSVW